MLYIAYLEKFVFYKFTCPFRRCRCKVLQGSYLAQNAVQTPERNFSRPRVNSGKCGYETTGSQTSLLQTNYCNASWKHGRVHRRTCCRAGFMNIRGDHDGQCISEHLKTKTKPNTLLGATTIHESSTPGPHQAGQRSHAGSIW